MENKEKLINIYISLMPYDLFEDGLLTKNMIKDRLIKLSINEINSEIKNAIAINNLCTGWE